MASSSSSSTVLHGKEKGSLPLPLKLFPSHGFAMEEQKKAPSACEQSSDGLRKVKLIEGMIPIFGSYGWSEHSSSSGLSSPFGSELRSSTETDETESEEDEDFIARLTRQMADYMLQDDEEEEDVSVDENDVDEPEHQTHMGWLGIGTIQEICYYNQESLGTYVKPVADSVNHQVKSSNTVFYSSDDLKRPIQVYHLKDQPTTAKQKPSNSRGKRVKGTTTESVQKLKTQKTTRRCFYQKQTLEWACPWWNEFIFQYSRTKNEETGSSAVLIPARMPQALQQHFSHMDALSQSNTCAVFPKNDGENEREDLVSKENQHSQDQTSHVVNDQEMQLPQEWTY
ncbi:hypothetical protein HAX54_023972 [Datura stramonium]|uniref:Uncharacterized protein n=1 Tax=Datura stramonium TaxID=4076 RepID=A0ABS8S5K5_DATST|nr:hypothetical protein [Datura stramonium]